MKKSIYSLLFISLFLLCVSTKGFCQSASDKGTTTTQESPETKSNKSSATSAKKAQSNSPIALKVYELLEKEPGYPSFISTGNKDLDNEKYAEAKNDWISKHPEEYKLVCQEAIKIVNETTK